MDAVDGGAGVVDEKNEAEEGLCLFVKQISVYLHYAFLD